MPDQSAKLTLSYDDPRLRMTLVGRLLVRAITWISYISLISAAALFVISDIARVKWIGIALILFLADRAVHRGESDLPIGELSGAQNVNVAKLVRPTVAVLVERAFDRSLVARHDFYLEFAGRLAENSDVRTALTRLDVNLDDFTQKLEGLLKESASAAPLGKDAVLKQVELLMMRSFGAALAAGHNFIEVDDCFSALAEVHDDAIDRLFAVFSIEPGDLARALLLSSAARAAKRFEVLGGFAGAIHHRPAHRIMNRAWTSRPTPLLDRVSEDLTDRARDEEIGFLIGHEEEFTRLIETLARPTNPNALLVGEAGIGKEAIIRHLAFQLTRDDVPAPLFDRRLVSLELQNLIAGATPEELQKRLQEIVAEIRIAGNIILFIPDIHNLLHTSGTAYLSAADALMPIIMSNEFPIIGTSYPREFKQAIEVRSDFTGVFEIIQVNEISAADAEKLLAYESVILERDYHITVSFGAIKQAVSLAKRFMHTKFLPSSAEDLLKSAIVDAQARGEKTLGPERVAACCEAKVHVPIHVAGDAEASSLLHLEETLHERLIGQDEAVAAVAQAIRQYRSGLSRQGGPIASFLFVGPTGVGKTELAKTLAKVQFGSEKLMVRFDMTEYQDKQSFFHLIGSPDGATRGALTDAVMSQPYSLILLDEFEKAFPDILNLFLQVLDDGRLTDNLGRTVDFTNTIIIATSNAHSDIINESLTKGESMDSIAEYLKSRLIDVFKPELLNRFSRIVVFKDLVPADLEKIVLLNLNELALTVKAQGMILDFDPAAVKKIATLGFDPKFGARPLRRVIDEKLRAPLADAILSKKISRGSRVKLVLKGDGFEFEEES